MVDVAQIKEHADVVGSDGAHVGTVDGVEKGEIKLTKTDPAAGGLHHYIPVDFVQSVEGGTVPWIGRPRRSSASGRHPERPSRVSRPSLVTETGSNRSPIRARSRGAGQHRTA